MKAEWNKWWSTIQICWSRYLAYRMDFILQIIGPAIVLFFVQYNLWTSVFRETGNINGYNLEQMLEYHLWSMVIILLGQGHMAYDLSNDIRLGRISSYLIYPFDFWKFHTANFLSFQTLQIFICSITVAAAFFGGILSEINMCAFFSALFFVIVVSGFWFALQFLTGITAFWLEETWILRVMAQILTRFLSGALIPLDFFPDWARNILEWTPFPLLTYYPIKLFTGQLSFEWSKLLLLIMWIVILVIINRLIWKKGMRLYTAAGM